jgi:hypothetical protein
MHRDPLDRAQRRWVAVLAAGPRAALAGTTAAELDGLRGFADETIHLVVPRGYRSRIPRIPGVQVHESRRLTAADVHPTRFPPRTRLARSVIDAAGWSATPARAVAVVAAAVQQRLVPVAAVRAELGRVIPLRHRGPLLRALDDIEGGAQSLAELRMGRLCRRAGLPAPVRQAVRVDDAGRRRYLDFLWPELGIWVEVDGGFHWGADSWCDDLLRRNDVALSSQHIAISLRYPSVIVRVDPDLIVAQLTRARLRAESAGPRPGSVPPAASPVTAAGPVVDSR